METLNSATGRRILWAAFLLLLPGVFMRYAAIGYGWNDPSTWINFATNSGVAILGLFLYLMVFFTLFVKGDRSWKPYFLVLSVIFSIQAFVSSLAYAQGLNLPIYKAIYKGYIASDPFYGGGPVEYSFPVALLSLISIACLVYLSFEAWEKVNENRREFISRVYGDNSFSLKVILGTLIYIALLALVIIGSVYEWQNNLFSFWDILTLILNLNLVSVFSLFFFSTIHIWWSELVKLASALKDFRLSKYITRMITGYSYTYLFMIIVLVAALATPIVTFAFYGQSYGMQLGWQLLLMVPLFGLIGAAIALSIILVIRLVFETSVALIHIAQNTSR